MICTILRLYTHIRRCVRWIFPPAESSSGQDRAAKLCEDLQAMREQSINRNKDQESEEHDPEHKR